LYHLAPGSAPLKGASDRAGIKRVEVSRCWRGAQPKYRGLLEDPNIKRWYDNVRRGSKITADVYLRRLGLLCKANGIESPKELIERANEKGERWTCNFLMDIVSRLESERKAGSYIESSLTAIKSWFAHNGVEVKGKIKIKGVQETPTLKNKRALNTSELALFLSSSPPQTRCAGLLVAEAGLRIESVGDYEGKDGLRISDLPEMVIVRDDDGEGGTNRRVSFAKVPTMIVVRPELSKARHQYFTFLTEEGCKYIAEYLTQRMRSGEELSGSSPLITTADCKQRKNIFVRSTLVGDLIRKRLRACGINARPYDLRSTFATQLMIAESKGVTIRDYRTFFMEHRGDIEHRYTTNRHVLPSEVTEDMRSSFARAQKYLVGRGFSSDGRDMRYEMRKQLLLVAGFSEEETAEMEVASMSNEEFHDAIKRRLLGIMANNGSKQKVISVDEVESYISTGWEFVAALPNDRAIVKVPF
jgi:integrase